MLNLLKLFRKEKLWDFQGGIHPPEMKTQSNGTPLSQLPLPEQFIIPLKQHIGHEGEICVSPGDHVLRGQPLTFGSGRMLPVHAPTSGTIEAIAPHMTAHPSGLSELCIFLRADGEDRWTTLDPQPDFRSLTREDVVKRIHEAGVAGLGGAGFPTATKLRGGLRGVKTLIINAAECEPYITADDRLMQDCAAEVLEGCRILAWVLQAERVLIGIEDNKPEAIAALKQALGGDRELQLRVIPTKYPSGGAKQLTQILTGVEVPHGGRSTDIGVLMQNVGTAWAVKRAIIDGEPITERVVTLTGEAIAQPRNVWGRLGTPVSHLLHHVGFAPGSRQMVIMGGPLMGFTLPSLNVPLVKISNCILAPSASEMGNNEEEQSCIRCSACADACPAKLLPQQLFWYSQGGDHEKARAHNIDDCIECGACAYVCPSNIPLVQYYRQEKAELRAIDLEAKRTAEAKARFEARQARLEREKLAREARHEEAKQRVARSDQGERDAAIARVKARAAKTPEQETAEREARHAQALAQQAEKQSETQPLSRQSGDPRKAAVEAAIARAKAKKSGVAEQPISDVAETPVAEADPRKAAVEAAIARAKAKKDAAAAGEQNPETADAAPVAEVDPRKAAVEAAIARAKAKKAAALANKRLNLLIQHRPLRLILAKQQLKPLLPVLKPRKPLLLANKRMNLLMQPRPMRLIRVKRQLKPPLRVPKRRKRLRRLANKILKLLMQHLPLKLIRVKQRLRPPLLELRRRKPLRLRRLVSKRMNLLMPLLPLKSIRAKPRLKRLLRALKRRKLRRLPSKLLRLLKPHLNHLLK